MARMILKLKEVRKDKGLSINQLADAAGVSPQYVVKLESDKSANPGMKVLGALCVALSCQPADLLALEEDKQ